MMVQVAPSFENMILLEDLEEETATNMASPYAMAVHMSFSRTCNVHLMPSSEVMDCEESPIPTKRPPPNSIADHL
jgi:hypothetical protein